MPRQLAIQVRYKRTSVGCGGTAGTDRVKGCGKKDERLVVHVGIRAPLSYAVTQTVRPTVTICIFCTLTPQGRDDAPRSSRVPHVWHRVTVAIHGYPTYHTYRTTALLPRDARTYIRVRRAMCHTREYMLYLSVTGRLLSDTTKLAVQQAMREPHS